MQRRYEDHANDRRKHHSLTVRKQTNFVNDKYRDLPYYVSRIRCKRYVKLRWFNQHFLDHGVIVVDIYIYICIYATKCKSSTLKLCLILKMHRYFLISAFLKRDWFCSLKILLSISTAPTGTSWNKVGVLFCQKGKCIGTYLKHIIPEILLKFLIGLLYENMFFISFKANNCSNLKQFAFNLRCLGLLGSITINLMLSPEVRR